MGRIPTQQSKTSQVNTFTGGINTDLHPLLQPNDTLTDCVNGTLITYNGNENMLQNDMGNYELKNAKLPEGYIPMGMREYQGVLYLVLMNPITKKVQIGSYPSPKTDFGSLNDTEEFEVSPVEIGTISELVDFANQWVNKLDGKDWTEDTIKNNMSEVIWTLISLKDNALVEGIAKKFLYSKLDLSKSSNVFTKDFDKNSMLTIGDKYAFEKGYSNGENSAYEDNPPFQTLEFFTMNDNKEIHSVDSSIIHIQDDIDVLEKSELDDVAWHSNGWLGAKYSVENARDINQSVALKLVNTGSNVSVSEYQKTTDLSTLQDTGKITVDYKFKVEGLDTENKILDIEEYVEAHKRELVFLSGYANNWGAEAKYLTINENVDIGDTSGYPIGVSLYKNTPEYKATFEGVSYDILVCKDGLSVLDNTPKKVLVYGHLDLSSCEHDTTYYIGKDAGLTGELSEEEVNILVHEKHPSAEQYQTFTSGDPIVKFFDNSPTNASTYYVLVDEEEVSSFKIGLQGTWNSDYTRYIPSDNDSPYALTEFIGSLEGVCTIILPEQLPVRTVWASHSYIVTYSGNHNIFCAGSGSGSYNVYTNNEGITFEAVHYTFQGRKIWEYQFSDPQIKFCLSKTKLSGVVNYDTVKASFSVEGGNLFINVKVLVTIEDIKALYLRGIGNKATSIHEQSLDNILVYVAEEEVKIKVDVGSIAHTFYEAIGLGVISYGSPVHTIVEVETGSMVALYLPPSVKTIKYGAFSNQEFLESVYMPGVTHIEPKSFYNCPIKHVLLNNPKYVGYHAFTQLETICILSLSKECVFDDQCLCNLTNSTVELTIPNISSTEVRNTYFNFGSRVKIYCTEISHYGNKFNISPQEYEYTINNNVFLLNGGNLLYPPRNYAIWFSGAQYINVSTGEAKFNGGKKFNGIYDYGHNEYALIASDKITSVENLNVTHRDLLEGYYIIEFPESVHSFSNVLYKNAYATDAHIYVNALRIESIINSLTPGVSYSQNNIYFPNLCHDIDDEMWQNDLQITAHLPGLSGDIEYFVSANYAAARQYIIGDNSSRTVKVYWDHINEGWAPKAPVYTYTNTSTEENTLADVRWDGGIQHLIYRFPIHEIPEDYMVHDGDSNDLSGIFKVEIPDTVCDVRPGAFCMGPHYSCEINMPESLCELHASAFSNCTIEAIYDSHCVGNFDVYVDSEMCIDSLTMLHGGRFRVLKELNTPPVQVNQTVCTNSITNRSPEYSGHMIHGDAVWVKDSKECTILVHNSEVPTSWAQEVNIAYSHAVVENSENTLSSFRGSVVLQPDCWNSTFAEFTLPKYIICNNEAFREGAYKGTDLLKYMYVSKDFDFITKFKVFYLNKNDSEAVNYIREYNILEEGITSFNVETNELVIPEGFSGTISAAQGPLSIGSISWEDLTTTSDGHVENSIAVGATLTVSTENHGYKIATMMENPGEDPVYQDSSGDCTISWTHHNYTVNGIKVSSLPYKFSGQHLLIYDNFVSTDVIDQSTNEDTSINKFVYCRDSETDTNINIEIDVNYSIDPEYVKSLAKAYYIDSGVFMPLPTPTFKDSDTDYTDHLNITIDIQKALEEKFVIISLQLDEDDSYMLPVYTKIDANRKKELEDSGYKNFAELYIDDLENLGEINVGNECITGNSSSEKYITLKMHGDEYEIIHESPLEYYWYNGITNASSQSDDSGDEKTYCFGKGRREDLKVNLTKLGIDEGDIISITGVDGKDYSNIEVSCANYDLFEKVDGGILLKINTLNGYNVTECPVAPSEDNTSIGVRKYLIHHCAPPFTHSAADLEWDTENCPIGEHTGWNGPKSMDAKALYITKTDGCNSNVQINVASISEEAIKEDGSYHTGATVCSVSGANEQIFKATGGPGENTKQLFTLVAAKLDVNNCGYTLPIPKVPHSKLSWLQNKKNKGTKEAIVLTRSSKGLLWVNQLHKAIAHTGITAGVAGTVTSVVAGCIAAATAPALTIATTTAAATATATAASAAAGAALAAVPFVGWAILALAVIAASIYLLTKVCAGEDQEVNFFAIKGSEKYPLVIPMWGSHTNCRIGGVEYNWAYKEGDLWKRKSDKRLPWYFDPDHRKAEEFITMIMTRVYYEKALSNLSLAVEDGADLKTYECSSSPIKITTSGVTTAMYGLDKYEYIKARLSSTNNFSIRNTAINKVFNIQSNSSAIENDFDVFHQDIPRLPLNYKCALKYDKTGDAFINAELGKFVENLCISQKGNAIDIHYTDDNVRSKAQDAFGGNSGGKTTKYKVPAIIHSKEEKHTTPLNCTVISGEYPKTDLPLIPLAYGVKMDSQDNAMVKNESWGYGSWGNSIAKYTLEDGTEMSGSKYFDHIKWSDYSDAFKITCNTNEI